MYGVLSGALMMGCLVTSLFFFKFWKKTHDKLFIMFSAAFGMLSFERLVLGYIGINEVHTSIYFIRLSAFVMILLAVINKNREPTNR